jgi:ubiquinone/menaquinone biosynthesis C-methylase UbiE
MDATEFKRVSQAVWEAMAPGWDDRHAYLEKIAGAVTERMLEELAPARGDTILELAAGTGVVGFAAASLVGPEGRVIVTDFSMAMVDAAERHAKKLGLANVECRVLDAERLDLPAEYVDGILCRWGYMLMADPLAALKEARRVLRRGGRLSCAVFAGPDENPWAALPMSVLQERGHVPPPKPGAPGILALADRTHLRGLFAGAGFSQTRIDDVAFDWSFRDVDDFWEFLTGAAGAIAIVLRRLDEAELSEVRNQIAARTAPFTDPDGIRLPGLSLVAAAS